MVGNNRDAFNEFFHRQLFMLINEFNTFEGILADKNRINQQNQI